MLLKVEGLACRRGGVEVLGAVALEVLEGELVALVGRDGAGKSSLLHAVAGVLPASAGTIWFAGEDVTRRPPAHRLRLGIAAVPEGRHVFARHSVEDNLRLGAYSRPRREAARTAPQVYEAFPELAAHRGALAASLPAALQQQLAIGRALMAKPRLLLLDEPSRGLDPPHLDELLRAVERLKALGITVLLAEQNAYVALTIAERGYVLERGAVVLAGSGRSLRESAYVQANCIAL